LIEFNLVLNRITTYMFCKIVIIIASSLLKVFTCVVYVFYIVVNSGCT